MSIDRRFSNAVFSIVLNYATWSRSSKSFILNLDEVPVYELNNAIAILLEDDYSASEANGPDNDEWEQSMRPALWCAMKNQDWELAQREFADTWVKGVRKYFDSKLQEEIDYHLDMLGQDRGDVSEDRDDNLCAYSERHAVAHFGP